MYWRLHETGSPGCCFYPRISVLCWQRYIFTFLWSWLFTTLVFFVFLNSFSIEFNFSGSHLSPLPVSKLPSSCGYTLRSTQKAFVLVAPYDGCFVTLEVGYSIVKAQDTYSLHLHTQNATWCFQEDSYVLPLRWLGLPVKMSCPLSKKSSPSPPMVTCHAEGMVVKTEWSGSDIKVNRTFFCFFFIISCL